MKIALKCKKLLTSEALLKRVYDNSRDTNRVIVKNIPPKSTWQVKYRCSYKQLPLDYVYTVQAFYSDQLSNWI